MLRLLIANTHKKDCTQLPQTFISLFILITNNPLIYRASIHPAIYNLAHLLQSNWNYCEKQMLGSSYENINQTKVRNWKSWEFHFVQVKLNIVKIFWFAQFNNTRCGNNKTKFFLTIKTCFFIFLSILQNNLRYS